MNKSGIKQDNQSENQGTNNKVKYFNVKKKKNTDFTKSLLKQSKQISNSFHEKLFQINRLTYTN